MKNIWQFIKFGVVGVANTAADYIAAFIVLHFVYGNELVAQLFGILAASVSSYMLNRKWTFDNAKGGTDKFLQVAGYGFTMGVGVSALIFWLFSGFEGELWFWIKKLAVSAVSLGLGYFVFKYLIFRKEDLHEKRRNK